MKVLILILSLSLISCRRDQGNEQSNVQEILKGSFTDSDIETSSLFLKSTDGFILQDHFIDICNPGDGTLGLDFPNGGLKVAITLSRNCPLIIAIEAYDQLQFTWFNSIRDLPQEDILITFKCPPVPSEPFRCDIAATILNEQSDYSESLYLPSPSVDNYKSNFKVVVRNAHTSLFITP